MTYIATRFHTGSIQGPTVIPFVNMHGKAEGTPHHPGIYGRYLVIDLTANNRASIDAWCERNPDKPRPDFGFGVCRHGFGLQEFGDGYMSERVALARARALNEGRQATDIPNAPLPCGYCMHCGYGSFHRPEEGSDACLHKH